MNAILPVLGALENARRPLVSRNSMAAALGLTRAQVNTSATTLAADGSLVEVMADVARFTGPTQRLLLEGQRTNSLRNPRVEGAAPGTQPTHWFASIATSTGVTATINGAPTVAGVRCLSITLSGTPVGNGFLRVALEGNGAVAASTGQAWSLSLYQAAINASGLGQAQFQWDETTSGGGFITTGFVAVPAMTETLTRVQALRTLSGGGTVGAVRPFWRVPLTNGIPVLGTILVGGAQFEQGRFASSVMLPPGGSVQASTRGGDQVTASLSNLGIGAAGACTFLWSGLLPQTAPTGSDQVLLQLDDGTDANRVVLANPAGSATVELSRASAGATLAAPSLGSVAAGSPFRLAVAVNAAGRAAASLNGGAVQAVAGVPMGLLALLRLGSNAAGTLAMFGEVIHLSTMPFAVGDAALPGLSSSVPMA